MAWLAIGGFVLVSLVLGLIVIPSREQKGFDPLAVICRALGIPGYGSAGSNSFNSAAIPVSQVAWSAKMRRTLAAANPQRGAEIVKKTCAACHGAFGISADPDDFPNLAGQYKAAIYKQLRDFQTGARKSVVMAAMAKPLSEAQMVDITGYFAGLPPAHSAVAKDAVPPSILLLVAKGDPVRGNAACNACHGANRNGPEEAPALTGQSTHYIEQQLKNFASAERGNDFFERMRSIARLLTPDEMRRLAIYYGGAPA